MRDVVIVSAVRTPIGNFDGVLKELSALDLGSVAIREAVKRAGIDPLEVDEVIMGNVLSSSLGQNPARQAMIRACLPMSAGASRSIKSAARAQSRDACSTGYRLR